MRSAKAIFIKQMNDLPKNYSILIQFILYPVIAFAMTWLMGDQEGADPHMFIAMFAPIFVGSAPLITVANAIAEDVEHKSLRFLVMAGVKSYQYLLGLAVFVLIVSIFPIVAFGLIAEYGTMELLRFSGIMLLGTAASIMLGAGIGIFSRDVQQCAAYYTPAYMLLAFLPMMSMFNPMIARISQIMFTHQIMEFFVADAEILRPLLIILANIAVLTVFFIVAYRKKGLKG